MGIRLDLASIRRGLTCHTASSLSPEAGKRAAVAAILRPQNGDTEVLLIRRAEVDGDPWSGQMAFPGGHADPGDTDLVATAQRETFEEIGLALNQHGRLLGRLDDLPAVARGRPTGLVIRPYVFELHGGPRLSPGAEVSEIVWAALGPMAHGNANATKLYTNRSQQLRLPAFQVRNHLVWGLTYGMLRSLLALVRADLNHPG